MAVLVLHHSNGVELGYLETVLTGAGVEYVQLDLETPDGQEALQDLAKQGAQSLSNHGVRAVVVLGGFMSACGNVDSSSGSKVLEVEAAFIRDVCTHRYTSTSASAYASSASECESISTSASGSGSGSVPVLGLCLGMQLMAVAAGGRVESCDAHSGREYGLVELELTPGGRRDRVLGHIGDRSPGQRVISWHNDCVTLPENDNRVSVLASSKSLGYVHAFRFGSGLGLQFHPEASPAMVETWMKKLKDESDENRRHLDSFQVYGEDRLKRESVKLFEGIVADWGL